MKKSEVKLLQPQCSLLVPTSPIETAEKSSVFLKLGVLMTYHGLGSDGDMCFSADGATHTLFWEDCSALREAECDG